MLTHGNINNHELQRNDTNAYMYNSNPFTNTNTKVTLKIQHYISTTSSHVVTLRLPLEHLCTKITMRVAKKRRHIMNLERMI